MTIKFIFLIYLLIAAGMDIFSRKVNNIWIITGIFLAGALLCFPGSARSVDSVLASAVVLLLVYPLYRYRMIGAGDGKLIAVTAFFTYPGDFFRCLLWTFMIASVYGYGKDIYYGSAFAGLVKLRNYLTACFREGRILPYEVETDKRRQLPLAAFLFIGVCIVWRRDIETLLCNLR